MAVKKYKIKARLYDNPVSGNPNDLVARVMSPRSLTVEDICALAIERGAGATGTTLGTAGTSQREMADTVNAFLQETICQLCGGNIVTNDLFTVAPKVKGSFNGPKEKFFPGKHKLIFYFHQGAALCQEAKAVEVDVAGLADVAAYITQVTDVKTGSVNDIITPTHVIKIAGNRLKIAGDNKNNGIYFVNETSGEKTKADITNVVNNNPSELMLITPPLTPGKYKIEITTQYAPSQYLMREPKTAVFGEVLTVV